MAGGRDALNGGVGTTPKTASKAAVFCHLPTDTLILMCLADGCSQKDRCGETERSGFRKAWQARRAGTGE
jgi:hypothetical protein